MSQATDPVELANLVELQARWENLPMTTAHGARDLAAKQSAYEAYRSRQLTYNSRHEKAHDPPVLMHTPVKLAIWLRAMSDLFTRAEADPRCPCPVNLVEKASRSAVRLAARLKTEPPVVAIPATVRAAVEGLQTLAGWCDRAAQAG